MVRQIGKKNFTISKLYLTTILKIKKSVHQIAMKTIFITSNIVTVQAPLFSGQNISSKQQPQRMVQVFLANMMPLHWHDLRTI